MRWVNSRKTKLQCISNGLRVSFTKPSKWSYWETSSVIEHSSCWCFFTYILRGWYRYWIILCLERIQYVYCIKYKISLTSNKACSSVTLGAIPSGQVMTTGKFYLWYPIFKWISVTWQRRDGSRINHRSHLILAKVMAWCLLWAPSH